MGQGAHKKLRIIHEFELYKFELDTFDCITKKIVLFVGNLVYNIAIVNINI